MQLAKFKEAGEALSIVAVIVTLLFLILEVRENTAAIRTDSYGETINKLNDWRLQLASEKELTAMIAEFNAGELRDLDQTERQQFSFIIGSLWSIYETAYFANGYGTLGDSEWSRFEQIMCRQYTLAVSQAGWDMLGILLSPEFVQYTEVQCR
jgi:hypothetical protein